MLNGEWVIILDNNIVFFILFLDLGFFVMFFTRLYFNLWIGFFLGLSIAVGFRNYRFYVIIGYGNLQAKDNLIPNL